MKKKRYTFLYFIFAAYSLFAQENFKVEKIDNSKFPYIKVFVSTQKHLDLNKLFFYENNKALEYVCDTIEGNNYGNGSASILFVINQYPEIEVVNALKKTIKKLSKHDKINLAIIINDNTKKSISYYISPCFSNNHEYFINFLNQNTADSICYMTDSNNIKLAKVVEKKILHTQDIYSNKAIIVFVKQLKKANFNLTLFKQIKIPLYILISNQADSSLQKDLSNICKKTGGICSFSEPYRYKNYLNSYIKDISLNKNSKKTEMLRFMFETSQHKKRNFFKIIYDNNTSQHTFDRLQNTILSFREQMLLLLSGMLLILLLIVVNRNKRVVKKLHLGLIKNFKPTEVFPIKNIEINVKTKGFNKTYFFEKHIIRIGRGEDNDIIIPDRTVSVSHALINREGNNFILQDLGSTNGVLINQKKIKKQILNTNDKIKMGASILIIRV